MPSALCLLLPLPCDFVYPTSCALRLIGFFKFKNPSRLRRRGHIPFGVLDDFLGNFDLFPASFRQLSSEDPGVVFQAHADVPAHDRGHDGRRKLIRSHAAHRPGGIRRKKALHVHHVQGSKGHASGHAEDELEVHRLLENTLFSDQEDVMNSPEVVNFTLRLDAVFLHGLGEIHKHLKGVLKDEFEKDFARLIVHQPKVHGIGIQRGQVRLHLDDGGDPLLGCDPRTDGGTHVDDQLRAAIADGRDGFPNNFQIARRKSIFRIAGMDMDNGGSGFPAFMGFFRKFLWGIGHRRVLFLSRRRPGQRRANDNLFHNILPFQQNYFFRKIGKDSFGWL